MAGRKPSRKKRMNAAPLALLILAASGLMLLISSGVRPRSSTGGALAGIAHSRARLAELEAREPVDLQAEAASRRRALLKEKNGILVEDLAAEQQKILAMTDADWNPADLLRWFDNTAIVGDSIIRQVRLFHLLDAPVFAEGGIHISVELPLLDQVEAARPKVVFLCFGMNDVGVFEDRVDRYVDRYANVIRRLQISLPDAVIYVHGALPVSAERLAEEPKYARLPTYNEAVKAICPELGAYYIDSGFILEARPDLYNVDGRHPKEEFYPMWLTYLADCTGLNHE